MSVHHHHHLFSLRTHFENLGAENLPLNVISFFLSLCCLIKSRERKREKRLPFFRERKRAEERGDPKERRPKDDREKEEGSLVFTHFFKISLSFLSNPDHRKSNSLKYDDDEHRHLGAKTESQRRTDGFIFREDRAVSVGNDEQ